MTFQKADIYFLSGSEFGKQSFEQSPPVFPADTVHLNPDTSKGLGAFMASLSRKGARASATKPCSGTDVLW
jgi:hypothetical protein